jgi:hypothetical protein
MLNRKSRERLEFENILMESYRYIAHTMWIIKEGLSFIKI